MRRLATSRSWGLLAPVLALLSLLFLAGCAAAGTTSLGSLVGAMLLGAGLAVAALGIQGCGGGGSTATAVINQGGGGGGRRILDFPGRHTGLAGVNFKVAVGDLDGDGFPETVSTSGEPGRRRSAGAEGRAGSYLVVNHNNTRGGLQIQGAHPLSEYFSYGVTLGDLDGDGDLDAVAANPYDGSVSVLLNQGDGTFGAAAPFATADGCAGVALGDLDGDGDLDAATANVFDESMSVLEGNGDGTFGAPATVGLPGEGVGVAVGDLDGDGDLDVAVPNTYYYYGSYAGYYYAYVSVFENQGGDFSNRNDFAGGYFAASIAVGDLDGDGDLDIATDSRYSDVYALLNDGTGGFATYDFYANYPYGVALGDLNGDGNLDLAAGSRYDRATVLLGDGSGSFLDPVSFLAGEDPSDCVLADANGDGNLDVFLAEPGSYTVGMLPGLGDGTLEEAPGFGNLGGDPFSLRAGDLDGDGDPDLAVAVDGEAYVFVLFNDGAGGFPNVSTLDLEGNYYQSVALGDVDGDGSLDLVLSEDTPTNTVVSLLNDGSGGFGAPIPSEVGGGSYKSTELGDVNADGDLDLVTTSFYSGDVVVALGNGDGTFDPGTLLDTGGYGTRNAVLGDLDGDGDLDIVAASDNQSVTRVGGEGVSNPYTVAVFLNDGSGGFGAATTFDGGFGPPYAPRGLALGDLDGDGILDLAITNGDNYYGFIQTLLGDGTGAFAEGELSLCGADPRGLALGDLDGDGVLDLVVAADSSEDNSVLLGLGDGAFQSPFGFGSGYDPHDIAIGDFNGDGLPDFASVDGSLGRGAGRTVEVFLQR